MVILRCPVFILSQFHESRIVIGNTLLTSYSQSKFVLKLVNLPFILIAENHSGDRGVKLATYSFINWISKSFPYQKAGRQKMKATFQKWGGSVQDGKREEPAFPFSVRLNWDFSPHTTCHQ